VPDPWDRLPEETIAAFAAAQIYFKLGANRSIAATQRTLEAGQGRGKKGATKGKGAAGRFTRWSSLHHWGERAAAWDLHVSRAEKAATERAMVEANERRAEDWVKFNAARPDGRRLAYELVLRRLQRAAKAESDGKPISDKRMSVLLSHFDRARIYSDEAAAMVLPSPVRTDDDQGSHAPPPTPAISVTADEAAAGLKAILAKRQGKDKEPEPPP
jgi:hypothetical protein